MKQYFIIMYDHSCGTNVSIFVLVHKLHFYKLFYTVENKNWNNNESYGMLDISLAQSFKINIYFLIWDTAPTRGHDF